MLANVPVVLVIDSGQNNCRNIKKLLKDHGYICYCVDNKEAGLALAREKSPDCIIVDFGLSESRNTDICKTIKNEEILKNVPIMMVTENEDEQTAIKGLKAGADDYVVNTINKDLFIEKIKNIVKVSLLRKDVYNLLDTREELLSIVSHDLKSPIGVIKTSLKLLLTDLVKGVSGEAREFIQRSYKQADYSIRLIQDILDLRNIKKKPEFKLEKFDVGQMIYSCVENIDSDLKSKNINLNIQCKQDYIIEADYLKLSRVVMNLLENAVKFSSKGGEIRVNVSHTLSKKVTDEKDLIKISIVDSGIGIPNDQLDTIFDKYGRVPGGYHTGNGLGLAICKEICTLHKGNIWVESTEGKGTTFHVVLPGLVEFGDNKFHAQNKYLYDSHNQNKKYILVVDDNEGICDIFKEVLSEMGYQVLVAYNGVEGLKLFRKFSVTMVFTDMQLPEMDGFELTQYIRDINSDIPVVLMTAYYISDNASKSFGIKEVLRKPFGAEEITKALATYHTIQA